jgi:hypothetical protein
MHRIPGLFLTIFLLTVVLSLAFFMALNEPPSEPAVAGQGALALVALGFTMCLMLAYLGYASYRAASLIYRHGSRFTEVQRQKTIQRLVKTLASKDKVKAMRAARLLGELTDAGEVGPGLEIQEGKPGWSRWNEWWLEHRSTTHASEDRS